MTTRLNLQLRVDERLERQLVDRAAREHTTLAEAVRRSLEGYFALAADPPPSPEDPEHIRRFYALLARALRDGAMYASAERRDEAGHPQPPAVGLPQGRDLMMLGWRPSTPPSSSSGSSPGPTHPTLGRWRSSRWCPAAGALEAGVLYRSHEWPYALRIRTTMWPGDFYTRLEQLAALDSQEQRPIPGARQMLELLAVEGLARGLGRRFPGSPGRFWSPKPERCRILNLQPLFQPGASGGAGA